MNNSLPISSSADSAHHLNSTRTSVPNSLQKITANKFEPFYPTTTNSLIPQELHTSNNNHSNGTNNGPTMIGGLDSNFNSSQSGNKNIWNDPAINLNLNSTNSNNSIFNPNTNTSYTTGSVGSPVEYKKFSNVEHDPLASQMLQLSANANDSLTQMPTTSLNTNPYFNTNSNANYNRHLTENKSTNNNNWTNSSPYNTNYFFQSQLQQQQQLPTQNTSNSYSRLNKNSYSNASNNNNNNNNNQFQYNGNLKSNINSSLDGSNLDIKNYNNNMDSRALKRNTNQQQSKSSDVDSSEIENYKTNIQLKDIIISKLEFELTKLKDFQNTVLKTQNDSNGNFDIPKNHEELYNELVQKLNSSELELQDTKLRLESLITAISMNPNTSTYKSGRYDEEEIAHKIISKLKMLTEENDELSRMVSYGKSKEKDIEIALLRKQNNDLLEKLAKLESKLNEKK